MSYRITGPNLDKTMSGTETKSVLCANKMMSDNITISRVTSESENLVITGPNLSKTNTTGTILCANKMMSGNVQFAHTSLMSLAIHGTGTNILTNVVYDGVTYSQDGIYSVPRNKQLTVTKGRYAGAIYLNENVLSGNYFTPDSSVSSIAINISDEGKTGYVSNIFVSTGTGDIVSINIDPSKANKGSSGGTVVRAYVDPSKKSYYGGVAHGYAIKGTSVRLISWRVYMAEGDNYIYLNDSRLGTSPQDVTVTGNITGHVYTETRSNFYM